MRQPQEQFEEREVLTYEDMCAAFEASSPPLEFIGLTREELSVIFENDQVFEDLERRIPEPSMEDIYDAEEDARELSQL